MEREVPRPAAPRDPLPRRPPGHRGAALPSTSGEGGFLKLRTTLRAFDMAQNFVQHRIKVGAVEEEKKLGAVELEG